MGKNDEVRAVFRDAEGVELPEEFGPPPTGEKNDEAAPEDRAANYPLNDYGNGLRLQTYFGDDLRYISRLGWFAWIGTHWSSDEDEIQARKLAQGIAEKILKEIWRLELSVRHQAILSEAEDAEKRLDDLSERGEKNSDEKPELNAVVKRALPIRTALAARRKSHRSHARTSGNTARISAMLLESSVGLSVDIETMNSDPLVLNTESGTLRFFKRPDDHAAAWGEKGKMQSEVELLDHNRDHKISKLCPVEYDPKAKAPLFMSFLENVQPDPELLAFIKRWFGYCITGLTVEQKMAFFYGGGRNGKSTLVDLIANILGDYSTMLPIETLTGTEQRKGSDATPDLVRLPGARLVRAAEPEQGTRMKEALIKQLTGGEPIMIRRMMKEFVEIMPEFKMTISGNHKPEIRGSDDGIWRRVLLVPWEVQIPEKDVDYDLSEKLWAERSGVLNWLVEGALEYLTDGLNPPESVIQATEEYRLDSDPVRVFLQEECEITPSPNDFVLSRDMIEAFNCWLYARGEGVWGKRTVANALKARAGNFKDPSGKTFTSVKRSDTGYAGIKLRASALATVEKYSGEVSLAVSRKR